MYGPAAVNVIRYDGDLDAFSLDVRGDTRPFYRSGKLLEVIEKGICPLLSPIAARSCYRDPCCR